MAEPAGTFFRDQSDFLAPGALWKSEHLSLNDCLEFGEMQEVETPEFKLEQDSSSSPFYLTVFLFLELNFIFFY